MIDRLIYLNNELGIVIDNLTDAERNIVIRACQEFSLLSPGDKDAVREEMEDLRNPV